MNKFVCIDCEEMFDRPDQVKIKVDDQFGGYEIDSAITDLADPETGEMTDYDALDRLLMERERKIENVALWYKNLNAEAKAIDDEIKALKERKDAKTKKAEKLKGYLEYALNGENFETAAVKISRRKTSSVRIGDQFMDWAVKNAPGLVRISEPEPNKVAIKSAIKDGDNIPFAELYESYSLSIK